MTAFTAALAMLMSGGAMGLISKLLDIYTSNLGNIFSQMSIWILIGAIISIRSQTKGRAAINMLCFCIGMLITYYVTAELTSSVYSLTYVYGWAAFTLCSPLFAVLVWMTNQRGMIPLIISLGVPCATLLISIVLFDGPRIYDILIIVIEVFVLFKRRRRNLQAEKKT